MTDIRIPLTYNTIVPKGLKNITLMVWVNYSIPNMKKRKCLSRNSINIEAIILTKSSLQIIHNNSIKIEEVYKEIKIRLLKSENDAIFYNLFKQNIPENELKQIDKLPYTISNEEKNEIDRNIF